MTARRLASFACGVVIALSPACQILSCQPPRCLAGDAAGACAPLEFCSAAGFCQALPPLDPCVPEATVASVHQLHMEIADDVGVAAMSDRLFGAIDAALAVDLSTCHDRDATSACAFRDSGGDPATKNPGVLQPLGALSSARGSPTALVGFAPALSVAPIVVAHDPINLSAGFVLEALFKTPSSVTNGGTSILSMNDAAGGFEIRASTGGVGFLAGDRFVLLDVRNDATWMHVLCFVDVPALSDGAGDDDDVLCAVDGRLAFLPAFPIEPFAGRRTGDGTAPLTIGDAATRSDAAVAVVRMWSGDPFAVVGTAGGTLAREDGLLEEERQRLSRYVGLRVESGSATVPFAQSNLDSGFPRAQPVEHEGGDRFELVGSSWPRVFHNGQGQAGLLLEPFALDLLESGLGTCSPADVRPLLGRPDGCALEGTRTVPGVDDVVAVAPGFRAYVEGDPLVFSVFLSGGAAVSLRIDDALVCDTGTLQNSGGCDLEEFEDVVRMKYRFTAPAEAFTVSLSGEGVTWSPQLEVGREGTTPFAVLIDHDFDFDVTTPDHVGTPREPARFRVDEQVVFTGVDLGYAATTALRATVASPLTSAAMTPLVVSDDGDFRGRLAALQIVPADDAQVRAEVLLLEQGQQQSLAASDSFPLASGQAVRIGADLGPAEDGCSGCVVDPVQAQLPARTQWNFVSFIGGAEPALLRDADVVTAATDTLPQVLDVAARAPLSGCMEGQRPAISLLACAHGPCSERGQAWSGGDEVVSGPSLAERALAKDAALADLAVDVDDLYVEARFLAAGDGRVLELLDESGAVVFAVVSRQGDALVEGASTTVTVAAGVWPAGEWHQIACWAGTELRCTLNAGAPVVIDRDLGVRGHTITAARVSPAGGAVAFARAWSMPATLAASEIARIVDARVAASFGFFIAPRRSAFTLQEARASAASVPHAQGSPPLTVGAHWPRIVADGEGAKYLGGEGSALQVDAAGMAASSGTTITLDLEALGDGTFLQLLHAAEPPQAPGAGDATDPLTPSLTLEKRGAQLAVLRAADAVPELLPFAGPDFTLGVRIFAVTLESGGAPALSYLGGVIPGGQRLVLGGAPIEVRRFSIVTQ